MTSVYDFFADFESIMRHFRSQLNSLMNTLYGNEQWNYLFYCALMPVLLSFVFDIVMSFILSFRLREVKLFNCLSSKSWHLYSESKNKNINRSFSESRLKPIFPNLRFIRLNMFMIMKFKKFRSGDIIRTQDGLTATFLGMRMKDDDFYYAYKTSNGIYYSRLSPKQFLKSSGSQRIENTVDSVRKS